MPPPLPKSMTVSPGFASDNPIGFPHPADAAIASGVKASRSSESYRMPATTAEGASSPQHPEPTSSAQHPDAATPRSATCV